jgi:cell division protein FtsQ
MIAKVLKILLILVIPAGAFVLLSFASEKNRRHEAGYLNVYVDQEQELYFMTPEIVKSEVLKAYPDIIGNPVGDGDLRQIEAIVGANPFVDRAHVFRQIDGNIQIRVTQRQPLIRVVTAQNRSYYIDVNGRLMPLSRFYTARVIVATGHIHAGYSPLIDLLSVKPIEEIPIHELRLRDLFVLATYMERNPFLNAFFDHIYVTPNGQFELTPKNGAHIVEFGGIENMEEKFQKLLTFYQNGLTRTGWGQYSRISVKFRNQVVCSK